MDLTGLFVKFLPFITKGIQISQNVKDADGPEKKKIAIQHAVTEGAAIFEGVTGKDVVNEQAAAALAGHIIDGIFTAKDAVQAGKLLKTADGTPN